MRFGGVCNYLHWKSVDLCTQMINESAAQNDSSLNKIEKVATFIHLERNVSSNYMFKTNTLPNTNKIEILTGIIFHTTHLHLENYDF